VQSSATAMAASDNTAEETHHASSARSDSYRGVSTLQPVPMGILLLGIFLLAVAVILVVH
jgi:hypothetical protein